MKERNKVTMWKITEGVHGDGQPEKFLRKSHMKPGLMEQNDPVFWGAFMCQGLEVAKS